MTFQNKAFHKTIENKKVGTSYSAVPSWIWRIFYKFLVYCDLFSEPVGEWNNKKVWETSE